MPATAKLRLALGERNSVTPVTRPAAHSCSCSARRHAWAAASAAEHATSMVMHGPCSPRIYESRPAAIAMDEPVAAYTLLPTGDAASNVPNSVGAKPKKTPVRLPLSVARSQDAPFGETANARLSTSCAPCTKPACRARLAIAPPNNVRVASAFHRSKGTSAITSKPHSTKAVAICCDPAPAGRSALTPSTATPTVLDIPPPVCVAWEGACSGCIADASCRAVGWSKTIVLGSASDPAALCSWLRSSTAPSESMPASISGTSASTAAPPAVRFVISRTTSKDKPGRAAGTTLFACGGTVKVGSLGCIAETSCRAVG
eukprot:2808709-Prymnesium_polylepis.1